MRIYSLRTGKPYDGEPVDCRELLQSGKYVTEEPSEEAIAAELASDGKAKPADEGEVGAKAASNSSASNSGASKGGKGAAGKGGAGK